MTHLDDEFRFLPGDAERVGRSTPLPPVERVWADVTEGRRVSGLSFEPGRAPEYVFLHGAGLNAHGFDPTVLSLGAPALSLDLPGHGRSDWREDVAYRPDLLAEDVALALEAFAPEPVTLVGHSLGGLTAAVLAATRPQSVRELVLVDISPGMRPQRDAGSVSDFITGKREFDSLDEIVDRAVEFGIGHDRTALARGVALNTRQRADGRWEWAHHFAHLDRLPITNGDDPQPFAALWAPLLGLQGAGTPVGLAAASQGMVGEELIAEWHEKLPDSVVATIDGPHNLHEAAPVELAQFVRAIRG